MSHTHSASFDSAFLPVMSRQTHTPAPAPAQAPPATLPLLQPMDLASYCTPTPLISHTAVAYPAALSNERYTPHPQPHSLNPPQRGAYAGHASMASIDSIHSVGSLGSVSSLTSVFSGQTDAPAYPQSYSVSGTPYLHPTPLIHLGSTYDSPGQTQHHSHHDRSSVDVDAYGQGVPDSHSDWEQFRPGRAHELASGYGGLAEYDSLSEAIELRMSLGMGRADMSGMAGVHPADGLGMGTMPEWRGYPYAQPGYGDPALWGEMHEKMKTRRHVCPVCEKRFNRPSSLNTHMAVHTGAKPYKCPKDDCGRCFSVSSNLRRHMKTHNIREIKNNHVGPPSPRSGGPKTHPPSAHGNVGSSSPSELASPASSSCSAPSIHPPLELNPATASTTNASNMSPLTSLAPLTFPRAMHTHTRSNPLASLAPIGPIVPYTHSYPHSFSSFAYDSATPSLGLAATTATSGSGSGISAFGMPSGGAGNAGFNTPLPSGMSVLSFGSSSTATGLDQYSLRRSSASVGGD